MSDSIKCRVDDCGRDIRIKRDQLCHAHYMQQRAGKPFTQPQPRRKAQGQACRFDGCDKPVRASELCSAHYTQRRTGQALKPLAYQVKCTDRDDQGRKRCARCRQWQDVSNFHAQRTNADGLARWCRGCMSEKSAAYKETGVKRDRAFGLGPGQYDAMLADQGGRCGICGTGDPGARAWAVDHDHSCCPGKGSCGGCIRGLLCHKCNLALGLVGDDIATLTRMIDYLVRSTTRLQDTTHTRAYS